MCYCGGMRRTRISRLITNDVVLMEHELATIVLLQSVIKEDIELVPPSHTPRMKMPDFKMMGVFWEMKSPMVGERRTLERIFYQASRQSGNLVFDLRRAKGEQDSMLRTLERCFRETRKVRNMYIVTRDAKLQKYKK